MTRTSTLIDTFQNPRGAVERSIPITADMDGLTGKFLHHNSRRPGTIRLDALLRVLKLTVVQRQSMIQKELPKCAVKPLPDVGYKA